MLPMDLLCYHSLHLERLDPWTLSICWIQPPSGPCSPRGSVTTNSYSLQASVRDLSASEIIFCHVSNSMDEQGITADGA